MQRMAWTDERLEERFARIDERFDGVDRRFDGIDRRLDGIEVQLAELRQGLAALNARIDRIVIAQTLAFITLFAAIVLKG